MIGRRGILGLIASAPAAAKAAASGIGPVPDAFGYGGMDAVNGIGRAGTAAGARVIGEREWAPQRIASLVKELAGLKGSRADRVGERMRAVVRLDPDLSVNRSMSLVTKMRLQAERDVDRDLEQQAGWLSRELAELREQFPFL